MAKQTILILNGPNLNLLGQREPEIYGSQTLADIEQALQDSFQQQNDYEFVFYQSNAEGELIDKIHQTLGQLAAIVINPGGYTHTSVALRDALVACKPRPVIEVHLSNIYAREAFRSKSLVSPVVTGVVSGLGALGYHLAIMAVLSQLKRS